MSRRLSSPDLEPSGHLSCRGIRSRIWSRHRALIFPPLEHCLRHPDQYGVFAANDKEYLPRADAFGNAPESHPPVVRIGSERLHTFTGWPELFLPPAKSPSDKRVFQLRPYESSSMRHHLRKIEMFHNGGRNLPEIAVRINLLCGCDCWAEATQIKLLGHCRWPGQN